MCDCASNCIEGGERRIHVTDTDDDVLLTFHLNLVHIFQPHHVHLNLQHFNQSFLFQLDQLNVACCVICWSFNGHVHGMFCVYQVVHD